MKKKTTLRKGCLLMALYLALATVPAQAAENSTEEESCHYLTAQEASPKVSQDKEADAALLSSLDKVIKAQKITASTPNKTALKKLFTYVQKKCDYGRTVDFKASSGWEFTYAKQMLKKKKGSCYHYAAAYAFLARRATGLPVRICIGTSNAFNKKVWQKHAWVEIKLNKKWYSYDPNAARYSKLRKGKWYQQLSSSLKKKVYKTKKTYNVKVAVFEEASSAKAASADATAAAAAQQTETAEETKEGLKKEGGKYFYYKAGQKITNQWKTIKTKNGSGKTVSYRYYFGKDGAAYAGKKVDGVKTPAVKKIKGKTYGFDLYGHMLKGTYVINQKFSVFNAKTGVYNASKTKQLRKASTYKKNAASLRKLLGKPLKTKKADSCYGDGKDLFLYYSNFIVSLFRDKKGKEIVLGVTGR